MTNKQIRDRKNRKFFTGFRNMANFTREIGIQHPLVGTLKQKTSNLRWGLTMLGSLNMLSHWVLRVNVSLRVQWIVYCTQKENKSCAFCPLILNAKEKMKCRPVIQVFGFYKLSERLKEWSKDDRLWAKSHKMAISTQRRFFGHSPILYAH